MTNSSCATFIFLEIRFLVDFQISKHVKKSLYKVEIDFFILKNLQTFF